MKYLVVVLCAILTVSVALWWHVRSADADPPPEASTPSDATREQPSSFKPRAEIVRAADPILVSPCTLAPFQEQEIASPLDGLVQEILVALGQPVSAQECLARIDDRKLVPQVRLLEIQAGSKSAEMIARALYEEAAAKVEYALKANKSGLKTVPELELKTYQCEKERYAHEMIKAREERAVAQQELEKARWLLELHRVRSGMSGEITKIYKKAGETTRQAEALFRVARLDQLRVEGFCKVRDAGQLRPGMRVIVEPEQQGRQLSELVGHTGTVNDLAVSPDGQVLASAGEDRNVLLWSWPGGARLGRLVHPAEVHAVDVIGSPAGYTVITGGDDGQARVWDLSAGGELTRPRFSLSGHEGAVRSVRCSPDGKLFVSGGEDRRIGVWDLQTGKHRYWVHGLGAWKASAHQGAITSLDLTPEGLLVSAGRDNLLKVWRLDEGRAVLVHTYRGRGGDVARPGVSADGRQLLFDHGEELRLLDRDGGDVLGIMHNRRQGNFKEFARFSPSGRLILSAAGNGRVQLWGVPGKPGYQNFVRAAEQAGFHRHAALALLPPADHPGALAAALRLASADDAAVPVLPRLWDPGGREIRHYQLPGAAQARCGAFAPGERVFFTGGTDRTVRAWAVPETNAREPREAVLTFVGSELEQGTDLVRVQAVLDNRADGPRRLRPGSAVTLRIQPPEAGR